MVEAGSPASGSDEPLELDREPVVLIHKPEDERPILKALGLKASEKRIRMAQP